jgi:hypothetical protein
MTELSQITRQRLQSVTFERSFKCRNCRKSRRGFKSGGTPTGWGIKAPNARARAAALDPVALNLSAVCERPQFDTLGKGETRKPFSPYPQ